MSPSFICRCLLLVAAMQPLPASAADVLWYDQPAADWMTEALPVGNGRVGGMFFGGVGRERIQFNEESLWTGRPEMLAHANGPAAFARVYELLDAGKFAQANALGKSFRATDYGTPAYREYQQAFGAYQAFGDLHLDFTQPDGGVSGYRRELDLGEAVGRVRYVAGGVTFQREIFCSAPDQVMVVRLTADQPGRIHLRAGLGTSRKQTHVAIRDGRLVLSGKLADNGMAFEAHLAARTKGGTIGSDDKGWVIAAADEVELLLDAATDYRNPAFAMHGGGNPAAVCRRHLDAALKKPFAELKRAHVEDYRTLYRRCTLELSGADLSHLPTDERLKRHAQAPDPALEALAFQFGRYLLISSSRPGTLPANLQGIWNDSNNPPWTCDWHTDINVEMNYWPAEVTGLPECHRPLFDLIGTLRQPGTEVARRAYNARGWCCTVNTNPWGYADNRWLWRGGSGWLCQHLWEHYRYTGDKEFLAHMTNARVVAPKIYELIRFQGDEARGKRVEKVTIKGLTLAHTDRLPEDKWPDSWIRRQWEHPDAMIYLQGAKDCVIADCRLLHSGSTGVTLDQFCQGNRAEGNEIGWPGSDGVFLMGYGPGTLDVNHHNVITRNWIHDMGQGNDWHSGAVQIFQSGHNQITLNLHPGSLSQPPVQHADGKHHRPLRRGVELRPFLVT